jgi:hypothetical protein
MRAQNCRTNFDSNRRYRRPKAHDRVSARENVAVVRKPENTEMEERAGQTPKRSGCPQRPLQNRLGQALAGGDLDAISTSLLGAVKRVVGRLQ